jgi:predicted DNA-binding transcriptional regulator AlpA
METIFVRRKQLKSVTGLSPQHLDRLEKLEQFPKRVPLTDHPNGAKGWLLDEIKEWAKTRMSKRNGSK